MASNPPTARGCRRSEAFICIYLITSTLEGLKMSSVIMGTDSPRWKKSERIKKGLRGSVRDQTRKKRLHFCLPEALTGKLGILVILEIEHKIMMFIPTVVISPTDWLCNCAGCICPLYISIGYVYILPNLSPYFITVICSLSFSLQRAKLWAGYLR